MKEAGTKSVLNSRMLSVRDIGLCYRSPGVGKTLSAKHYTRWSNFKKVVCWRQLSDAALKSFEGHSTLYYCPAVANTPRQIAFEIRGARDNLRCLAIEPLRRENQKVRGWGSFGPSTRPGNKVGKMHRKPEAVRIASPLPDQGHILN